MKGAEHSGERRQDELHRLIELIEESGVPVRVEGNELIVTGESDFWKLLTTYGLIDAHRALFASTRWHAVHYAGKSGDRLQGLDHRGNRLRDGVFAVPARGGEHVPDR